jgi:sugar lactone lactonase YvrE
MTVAVDASVAVRMRARLGEGPWWDPEAERLLWVDIPEGLIHAHSPATGETATVSLEQPVGFVVGTETGGYLAGTETGLVGLDSNLEPTGVVASPPDLPGVRRINDGACDPAGRVLFGTVDPTGVSSGTLWSFAPDGSMTPVVAAVAMSNGLGFSPDHRRLYYVDSATRRVDSFAYDVDAGTATHRETLIRVPEPGLPDGLAVDSLGNVWVAIWGTGEVSCVTPTGRRVATVRVPVARTSSCAFGGPALDRLYITTARADDATDPGNEGPLDGAVFVADVGATGVEPWRVAGHFEPVEIPNEGGAR